MSFSESMAPVGRREFVKRMTLAAAALTTAETLLADPYAPLRLRSRVVRPVRVRGRVHAARRGVRGVGVTDGVSVVTTDGDGHFELGSTARQPYVYLSLPAGYRIPTHDVGTARLYRLLRPDRRGEMETSFELTPLDASDEEHAFLVLADPQTQNAYEVGLFHAQTVPDVRATARHYGDRPVFGVGCGDIMFDDLTLFPEYERAVAAMGVPFFQVVGNHDIVFDARTDEGSNSTFARHFGPAHYSFDRGKVHYVVLDDVFWFGVDYLGYLPAEQLAWLEADLATVERGTPVVVFLHIPVQSTRSRRTGKTDAPPGESVNNREALYRLLEPYKAHVMSGHTHESEHVFTGGVHEHVHGAVCGAWWSGPICWDGTPNGYGIYEVRGEEIRWQYKATGFNAAHQMRVYPHGADPRAPDEIVANVWGWDPKWTVVWLEDGERRGAMTRRPGVDPMSVELHTGPQRPERRPWVEPTPTGHLFYARASREAREIRVAATDRWGRVYSAVINSAPT